MKRLRNSLFGLLAFGLLLFPGALFAQNKTVIKLNPLSAFATTINVQAERAINQNMSFQLGGFYGGFKASFLSGSVKIKYKHFGITPEFRYYFAPSRGAAPSGLYGAAFFRYRQIDATFSTDVYDPDLDVELAADVVTRFNIPGGGVLIGYQFLFGDVFALDMFFGPQISYANTTSTVNCTSCNGNETLDVPGFKFGGFGIRTGVSLGLAF